MDFLFGCEFGSKGGSEVVVEPGVVVLGLVVLDDGLVVDDDDDWVVVVVVDPGVTGMLDDGVEDEGVLVGGVVVGGVVVGGVFDAMVRACARPTVDEPFVPTMVIVWFPKLVEIGP